ncbi:pilus assembly protein PilP [Aliivibrio sp. 1S128]|uniref:pilus assembly protein PilP n=1 Tax=Aliivibrio sp. 1S128 TaxID=1840085 RepID=UPI00080E0458|nr:pilus assembly protein PilP [Aliivibrio sp. 1S128]OCH25296.1 fimbrial protein [Aliivibrio sp. 1S128]
MNSRFLLLVISALVLVGCKANKESLDSFYIEAKQQGKSSVDTLSHALPFEVEAYSQVSGRSPFILPKLPEIATQPIKKKTCWQPQYRKKTGSLERFSLKRLRLKGVMGADSDITALVQTPKGNVVKVRKGQYMGSNNGQVVDIKSRQITLKETLPDGMGCWQKRYVKLALKH